MKKRLLPLLLATSLLLTSCGSSISLGKETSKESKNKSKDNKEEAVSEDAESDNSDTDESETSKASEDATDYEASSEEGQPLYKRLGGKYSYKLSEDEYCTIEITDFCGNLYAFGANAMEEDGDLTTYSFWAMEFLPENEEDLFSEELDKLSIGIESFSIMSNVGKYWGYPSCGAIRIVDDGIIFEDFESGFPYGSEALDVVFTPDDRVEDTFPYVESDIDQDTSDIAGLWIQKDAEYPAFIEITEDNVITIYKKEPGVEVEFGRGNYEMADDGKLTGSLNFLGSGGMPSEIGADIKADDKALSLSFAEDEYDNRELFGGVNFADFEKVDPDKVPIITLDEEIAARDSTIEDQTITFDDKPFYGVWVQASKDLDVIMETEMKLETKGFDGKIVYAPEWSNLTDEPYYCLSAGTSETEDDAKDLLEKVKEAGYSDAYVKYSGDRTIETVYYTIYSESQIQIYDDRIIIGSVLVTDLTGTDSCQATLVVDADTKFADTCDLSFFAGYEEGDTPFEWIRKNYGQSSETQALIGVFEVSVTGNHIDEYFGSYWWD